MKRSILLLSLGLIAVPALAEEPRDQRPADPPADMEQGLNLLQQGTELMLRGLADELAPVLEGIKGKARDLNAYHLPEVLPNGDIILRRRTPDDPVIEVPENDDGSVDL